MPTYDAVARWEWRESASGRRSQKMPLAPLHAAKPGAAETLCGMATEEMEPTGMPWPTGLGDKCEGCKSLADGG
jgi:hypothetical protein